MTDNIMGFVGSGGQKQVKVIDPRYMIQDTSGYVDVHGVNIYEFMADTYCGARGYRDGSYLIPFMRESFYEDRRRGAVYTNLFRPIIDAMVRPVFAAEVDRVVSDDLFERFIDNVDAAGTAFTDFTHVVITNARVYGATFVVVDNYDTVDNAANARETINGRLYPYIYEMTPYKGC